MTANPQAFRAIPAVDLKGGRCVQLVGGRPDDERVSLPDPVGVALDWTRRGFRTLHLVDLDAALGTGDNLSLIGEIAAALRSPRTPGRIVEIQVGGGVRDAARVEALLAAGIDRVIVGTRAVEDPDWLAGISGHHPRRIAVAADIRDGVVLRRGWTEASELRIHSFLEALAPLPLAGVLCTDVGREGRLEGIDRDGVAGVIDASPHPVWISGGVTTTDELDFLAEHGAAGAVLGMALYTGALDPDDVAERWG